MLVSLCNIIHVLHLYFASLSEREHNVSAQGPDMSQQHTVLANCVLLREPSEVAHRLGTMG